MARLLPAAVVLVVAALMSGCYPLVSTMQCDGELPTWMIEAQDYDGGGCAYLLPSMATAQRPARYGRKSAKGTEVVASQGVGG